MRSDAFLAAEGAVVPAVTAGEMAEVDRVAVDEFDLPLASMMENAGRNLAAHVRQFSGGAATVVAGAGGNGGGGLAAARHLHNRGIDVVVALDRDPSAFEGVPARQLSVLRAAGVDVEVGPAAVDRGNGPVVDAVVGYGIDGELRDTARELAEAINRRAETVVSLDVPTGLDATTGNAPAGTVDPDRVVTLALPKTGLAAVEADLFVADIAIPAAVFEGAGIDYESPFEDEYWIRLTGPA